MNTVDGFRIDVSECVATITIDRPEVRNALTSDMRRAFKTMIGDLDESEDVRAIILTGVDPSFCGGVDLKERFAGGGEQPRVKPNPGEVLRGCGTPVIAAVNGHCVSGGLEMALSCSFILASERATFRDTHARIGIIPGWGLSAMLPRAVGLRMAREMTITGRPLGAEEARAAGLANRVFAHEQLLPEAMSLALQIAEAEPRVVRATLALYRDGDAMTLDDALGLERRVADAVNTNPAATKAGFERITGA
jgi:enoyl-CoA hydratase